MSRLACLSAFLVLASTTVVTSQDVTIHPDEKPKQFREPQGVPALLQTTEYIRADRARTTFNVSGRGLAVAVLDTGLNTRHVDFGEGADVVATVNFTGVGGDADVTDANGHGTNVAGIVMANGDHEGIAPLARVAALKVLGENGGSFEGITKALEWVEQHGEAHNVSVVNMSLGDRENLTADDFATDADRKKLREVVARLRQKRVAVVVAAGNDFFRHQSGQGMAFPAIVRECVSVGALYDANIGPASYLSGAVAHSTAAGQVTPFSQRLHDTFEGTATPLRTDVFAPGAPLTSSGTQGKHGESIMHGTSQAAPVTAGVILLAQELHKRVTGELPRVDDVERWLRAGPTAHDTDPNGQVDNVTNTELQYPRVDAVDVLNAVNGQLRAALIREN